MSRHHTCIFLLFLASFQRLYGQTSADFAPPKPYREQLAEQGPVREISLQEAIATALRSNPEIEIENYNQGLAEAGVMSANSYYVPVASLNTSILSNNVPATNILQTGTFGDLISHSWSITPSIQENLPGGGTATVTVNLNRSSNNSDYSLVNPAYGSTVGFTVTQPLWRGFRRTAAEKQIIIARLNERMNESQFLQRVSGIVEQVINAYWRLMITIENYESQRQVWTVARAEYEEAQKAGDAAAIASQRSDVASHAQSLTNSAAQIIQASNALKRLLAPSVMDPVWYAGLICSERPDFKESSVSLAEAVKMAFERRPELEQLRLQMKQADAEVRFDKQETKPAVNLRLEAQSNGIAGTITELVPASAVAPYGGLGTAYRQSLTFQHPSVAAGLEVRLPLRNTAARSQLANALIETRKLETQLRATQEDIMVDIRNAWETIAVQKKNVDAAGFSRSAAEERLAVQTKAASAPESLDVLRDRRTLAEARVREWQALIDYRLSQVSLQKAMNALLDDQQIVLARRK
jgi:outer membrane protein TolC